MKKLLFAALMLTIITASWAEDLRISQIDTNALMFRGEIDIYFSLPGRDNTSVKADDFSVFEKTLGELEIVSLDSTPNEDEPINFILLIDNSGSMYDESFNGVKRIEQAKSALGSFLDRIEESGDRAAVYTFNSGYREIAPLGTDFSAIRRRLSLITRPEADQAYTELYNALIDTASMFPKTAGRRSVIVLSDGENYSMIENSGGKTGYWNGRTLLPDEVIREYHERGVTLDGISISDDKDRALDGLCSGSGGKLYDARSTEAINNVYSGIREKILDEFRIRVVAPPLIDNTGEISLNWENQSDSRLLMVPLLFGGSTGTSIPVLLVILLVSAAALGVLFIIPFDKPAKSPQIQSLDSGQKTIISSVTTIIGADRNADFTITNSAGVDPEHATIVQDEQTGAYTLVSKKPVRVNNRKVKTRKLNAGDVIRIEGSTIIFDEPDSTIVKDRSS